MEISLCKHCRFANACRLIIEIPFELKRAGRLSVLVSTFWWRILLFENYVNDSALESE